MTFPTEFTFRGDTYALVRIDGRRHGKKCECCGFEVNPRVNDFACGRKVLHTSCVAKMLAAPAAAAEPAARDWCSACGAKRPAHGFLKTAHGEFCSESCAHLGRGIRRSA